MSLLGLVKKIESVDNKHRRRVIIEEIAQLGVTPIIDSYEFKGLSGENIMTTFPGSSSKTILLASHSDTFYGSPGANDGASGCAVLIDLLRRFKDVPTKHSLKWIIFDQEEELHGGGRIGSQAYVNRYRTEDIVLVLEPKLVGRGDTLVAWTVSPDQTKVSALMHAAKSINVQLELSDGNLLPGDYQTFREKNIIDSFALAALPSQEMGLLRQYMTKPAWSYLKYKAGLTDFPSLFTHYHNGHDQSKYLSKKSLEMTSDFLFEAIQYLERTLPANK